MPFTFAHPAIVLPFSSVNRNYVSLSALIVGSITPDFEYFIRMKVLSLHTHTLAGIFYLDLPIATLLYVTFENVVRAPLTKSLPQGLKAKFSVYRNSEESVRFDSRWYIVLVSLLIGIASHLFWDSFTHRDGFFVNRLDWLKSSLTLNSTQIPMYKVAQHGSTMIGSVIIIVFILGMKKYPVVTESGRKDYWLVTILAALAVIAMRFLLKPSDFSVGNLIVTSIAGILLGVIVSSLVDLYYNQSKK